MAQHQPDYLSNVAGRNPDLMLNIARLLPKNDIIRLTSTNRMFRNFGGGTIAGRSLLDETFKKKLRRSYGDEYEGGFGPTMPGRVKRDKLLQKMGEQFVFPETHDAFKAEHARYEHIIEPFDYEM